jgi:hypothetical protein
VRIEQVTADRKTYDTARDAALPPLVRDLQLDFTALSLAAPEKVRFRYKLEGYDTTGTKPATAARRSTPTCRPRPIAFASSRQQQRCVE